jgi:hypothetical protein
MATLGGAGTKISLKIASTYTEVPEARDIKFSGPSVGTREIKKLTSTAKQKRPTLVDFETCSFSIYHDPNNTVHQDIQSDALAPSQTLREWRVEFPDGNTTRAKIDFSGYVSKYPVGGIEVEDSIVTEVEITISDVFTVTAGTP